MFWSVSPWLWKVIDKIRKKEKLKRLMCFTKYVLLCRKRGMSSQPRLYLKQVTLTLPPLLLQWQPQNERLLWHLDLTHAHMHTHIHFPLLFCCWQRAEKHMCGWYMYTCEAHMLCAAMVELFSHSVTGYSQLADWAAQPLLHVGLLHA